MLIRILYSSYIDSISSISVFSTIKTWLTWCFTGDRLQTITQGGWGTLRSHVWSRGLVPAFDIPELQTPPFSQVHVPLRRMQLRLVGVTLERTTIVDARN